MTGKRKPSEAERACIEAIDDAERDITAELLREFGITQPSTFSSGARPTTAKEHPSASCQTATARRGRTS